MLNMISTPFAFFIVLYIYFNKATCINFFSLLEMCNSNDVHINMPGRLQVFHFVERQK